MTALQGWIVIGLLVLIMLGISAQNASNLLNTTFAALMSPFMAQLGPCGVSEQQTSL
jgi:hypothetical protein